MEVKGRWFMLLIVAIILCIIFIQPIEYVTNMFGEWIGRHKDFILKVILGVVVGTQPVSYTHLTLPTILLV